MSKRRVKNESIENLKRVIDKKDDNVEVVGGMDVVMTDAYAESVVNQAHVDEVHKDLDDKAKGVVTDSPDTGKEVKNDYTAKLVLDEGVNDFALSEDDKDGRSRKVYDDDDEDDYLDYDMFDFIYGLVTDCWPKPLNPLNHKLRKFMYTGSDKYIENPNSTETVDGHSQVAINGDSIEVYANDSKDFEDIRSICKLYKFNYDGPTAKRSRASHWNFTFRIEVPESGNGYPAMVEDYFNDIGMTLEDVMPADFCKQYRKRMAKVEAEVDKRVAQNEVERIVNHAIMIAAQDNEPLQTHLQKLYTLLDNAQLSYQKSKIKKQFFDAFNDEE